MATVKGVNQTLIDAGGIAALTEGLVNGRVKVNLDHYVLTTGNNGDTIKLFGLLPAGAKVVAIMLSATVAQSGMSIGVGDLDSATRYSASNAGLQTAIVPVWILGTEYVIGTTDTSTTDTDRQVTVTLSTTATAATLYAALFWTTD